MTEMWIVIDRGREIILQARNGSFAVEAGRVTDKTLAHIMFSDPNKKLGTDEEISG